MNTSSLFRYSGLRDFLAKVREHLPIVRLGDWAGERSAVLRHDIDLDLEPAARLAEKLCEWGHVSTYLVLTTSTHYNPASARSRGHLRRILECGGEIGLHFDSSLYPNATNDELNRAAKQEALWLESLTGAPVRSLSLHNPHALSEMPLLDGFVNAYHPKIFQSGRYISDSCRRFRSDPEEFCRNLESITDPVQILLHPMHYHHEERTYPQIFDEYFSLIRSDCFSNFGPANATFRREMQIDGFS